MYQRQSEFGKSMKISAPVYQLALKLFHHFTPAYDIYTYNKVYHLIFIFETFIL